MTRAKQIYQSRFYEGEHVFSCSLCGCTYVEYSFGSEPSEFYDKQMPPACLPCGTHMEWAGWSGQSDITEGIVSLVNDGHVMAATVIVAAFVEYQIDSLLWATLVDCGLSKEKASGIANGTLPRGEAIRMIRNLLERKVVNVVFPIRNEVAHGRAFGRPQTKFIDALDVQFASIEAWVKSVKADEVPKQYNYKELDRWILSMEHWIYWIKNWWAETKHKLLKNSPLRE
jgi:hypothetical protein